MARAQSPVACLDDNECMDAVIECEADNDCNVICHGNNACRNSTIHCPRNGDCSVICNNNGSCREAVVRGPVDGELTVDCDGPFACIDAIFDAADSSLVNITGCAEEQSCIDIALWCPPQSNGENNCFLEGAMYCHCHSHCYYVQQTL